MKNTDFYSPFSLMFSFVVITSLSISVLLSSPAFSSEIKNLSETNKTALEKNISRLQQTELFRVSRGRLKANPIDFSLHTIYQYLLSNQQAILENLNLQYENSLMGLHKVFANYSSISSTKEGQAVKNFFLKELIDSYSLEEKLNDKKSLYEVYIALKTSGYLLESLSIRAGMTFNAEKWARDYFGDKQIPTEIRTRLTSIMNDKPGEIQNVFFLDEYINKISREYSVLFKDIAASGKTSLQGKDK